MRQPLPYRNLRNRLRHFDWFDLLPLRGSTLGRDHGFVLLTRCGGLLRAVDPCLLLLCSQDGGRTLRFYPRAFFRSGFLGDDSTTIFRLFLRGDLLLAATLGKFSLLALPSFGLQLQSLAGPLFFALYLFPLAGQFGFQLQRVLPGAPLPEITDRGYHTGEQQGQRLAYAGGFLPVVELFLVGELHRASRDVVGDRNFGFLWWYGLRSRGRLNLPRASLRFDQRLGACQSLARPALLQIQLKLCRSDAKLSGRNGFDRVSLGEQVVECGSRVFASACNDPR